MPGGLLAQEIGAPAIAVEIRPVAVFVADVVGARTARRPRDAVTDVGFRLRPDDECFKTVHAALSSGNYTSSGLKVLHAFGLRNTPRPQTYGNIAAPASGGGAVALPTDQEISVSSFPDSAGRARYLAGGAKKRIRINHLSAELQHLLPMVLNLAAAWIAGAVIGLERSFHGRPAGFRTHALVCLSSALLMIVMNYQADWLGPVAIDTIRTDPTRMAQGIMTGIGFLGAGVIFKDGLTVRGLTTAASIWTTAAIGILFGVGFCAAGDPGDHRDLRHAVRLPLDRGAHPLADLRPAHHPLPDRQDHAGTGAPRNT